MTLPERYLVWRSLRRLEGVPIVLRLAVYAGWLVLLCILYVMASMCVKAVV